MSTNESSLRRVVVIVQDGVEPFGLGALCEVWAEPDHPVYDFQVITPRPGRVRGASGCDLSGEDGLDLATQADLVCVAPKRDYLEPDEDVNAVEARDGETFWGRPIGAHDEGRSRQRDREGRSLPDPRPIPVQP